MDMDKAGWLSSLLTEVLEAHSRAPAPMPPAHLPPSASGRARARAWLRPMLRASGLVYGTPTHSADQPALRSSQPPEQQLLLAVLRTLARIALDVATLTGAPQGPRREQLLLLFAVLAGRVEDAAALERPIASHAEAPRRLQSRIEDALRRRALSHVGDATYGLLLHNGTLYADVQVFAHQALEYFSRGRLIRTTAERRLEVAARRKALLVDVLTALSCADRPPGYTTRRAILRQLQELGLPAHLQAATRAAVKQSFASPRTPHAIVEGVRSPELRRFILEQVLLASLVDGYRSQNERAFIHQLVQALHVSEGTLRELELEVAEFYARNRSVVDVFTLSAAADVLGQDLVSRIQETASLNFQRLMQEARETAELSVLLTKAARRQPLTEDERRRMRAQLIDVAKAIPALALFAAPGGALLLIALSKVLPFSLLPSSFQQPLRPALPPPRQGSEPPQQPPSSAAG